MLGKQKKSIDFVLQSLQIFEKIGDIRGKVHAQHILGVFHQNDDDCSSSSFFAQSILSFHSIRRSGIYEDQFNTSLSNLSNHTHKSLCFNLLNLKQVKAALLISDAGKAKALFDLTRRCVDVLLDLLWKIITPFPFKQFLQIQLRKQPKNSFTMYCPR